MQVDLQDDRFDITYDSHRATVAGFLGAIRELGFEPVVVARRERSLPRARVGLAGLPGDLRKLFAEARRSKKAVLIRFSGPG